MNDRRFVQQPTVCMAGTGAAAGSRPGHQQALRRRISAPSAELILTGGALAIVFGGAPPKTIRPSTFSPGLGVPIANWSKSNLRKRASTCFFGVFHFLSRFVPLNCRRACPKTTLTHFRAPYVSQPHFSFVWWPWKPCSTNNATLHDAWAKVPFLCNCSYVVRWYKLYLSCIFDAHESTTS